jgi:hypothetical protein
MSRPLTIAGHEAAQAALHAACLCVSLAAGKTAVEVAAAVAARAIASLRKRQPEAAANKRGEH